MSIKKNIIHWVYALLWTVVGGVASAGSAWLALKVGHEAGVDVAALDLKQLGVICLVSGLMNLFFYLKQSPLPKLDDEEETKSGVGPGSVAMLLILILPCLMLSACSSASVGQDSGVGGVTGNDVRQGVEQAIPFVRPAAALTCGAVLSLAVSDDDRVAKANQIYGIAKAMRTLMGGAVPTPSDLAAVIEQWAPDKVHWSNLATSISSIYGGLYAQVKGDPKLAMQVLEALAAGAEDGASGFIPRSTVMLERMSTFALMCSARGWQLICDPWYFKSGVLSRFDDRWGYHAALVPVTSMLPT